MTDKVLGRVRDIVPVRGVKLIFSPHDLLEELGIILVIKWRVATQPEEGGRNRVSNRFIIYKIQQEKIRTIESINVGNSSKLMTKGASNIAAILHLKR